jgi:hypothetical protein
MHEITNLTNSPYDLEGKDGPIRLPAMGKVSGVFTSEYLAALEGCGLYSIQEIGRKAPKTSPLDHDGNGKPGGMARSSKDEASTADIVAAIELLEPENNDHWTSAGLPAVEAVQSIAGKTVTRAQIEAAAPDAKRPEQA